MNNNDNFKWHDVVVRVRYAETDQSGVVYHANYLPWFEVGRVELCRTAGFNYKDMEIEDDAYLPVTEIRVKYRLPAKYDDEIIVRAKIISLRSRAISFQYELVRKPDGALLAVAESHHIVMNKDGKSRSLPVKFKEKLLARQ